MAYRTCPKWSGAEVVARDAAYLNRHDRHHKMEPVPQWFQNPFFRFLGAGWVGTILYYFAFVVLTSVVGLRYIKSAAIASVLSYAVSKVRSASVGQSEMLQMLHDFGTFGHVTFRANETNETQKRGVSKLSHFGSQLCFNQEKYWLSKYWLNKTPICRVSHLYAAPAGGLFTPSSSPVSFCNNSKCKN
jgi:hypothetical protein